MTLAESGLSFQDTVMQRYLRYLEGEAGSASMVPHTTACTICQGSSPKKYHRKSIFFVPHHSARRGKPRWLGIHEHCVFLMNEARTKVEMDISTKRN